MAQKNHLVIVILISLQIFCSCNTQTDNFMDNRVFLLNIENCKETADLKLSDLIDSCHLVQLETTNESLLGNSYWYIYITDEYIIVDDNNGISLFAADGKFIDKIIKIGRGPQEISVAHMIYYYEKENLLFINDLYNNLDYLLCYDVKSQIFKPPIKKYFSNQWGDFLVYNDSLIMGSPSLLDAGSNPYAIFFQNFKGNFISGMKSKRNVIIGQGQEVISQRVRFYIGDQKIHIKYIYDDTLFTLNENQLSPYLIISDNSQQPDLPNMTVKAGDKRSFFDRFENSSFMIFRNQTYIGSTPFNGGERADYKRDYFLLNKSNGNYKAINTYTDDLIGKIQKNEGEIMSFPSSLPNNRMYVLYSPLELLQNTSAELFGSEFPESLRTNLMKIISNLRETDNPVLLVGIPKKRIMI
jgi:hypothetical protein